MKLITRSSCKGNLGIDIFSPRYVSQIANQLAALIPRRVDLSQSSPHTRRRIWQEALITLFLINRDTEIPKGQEMDFKEARNGEFPPYLTNFKGTSGERMVENLKVCPHRA